VTLLRLLSDVGSLCADYHDVMVRNLQTRRVQSDELWSYCGCTERAKAEGAKGHGDVWTWVGLDSESKLRIAYSVADRSAASANAFMADLASRLTRRIQLTTDGYAAYPEAVEGAFGGNVDYAMLVKHYETDRDGAHRYSPPRCTGATIRNMVGQPRAFDVSTSHVERQNLTVRVGSRRLGRLTNAFSKRFAGHVSAVHLHYWHYNFSRKHQTLKTTPAVAAGIASKPMTMLDLVALPENEERVHGGRLTDYLPPFPKAAGSE
jgi:IS1 family transposase